MSNEKISKENLTIKIRGHGKNYNFQRTSLLCCDLPVADAKGLPKSGELLVEVKVEADFVLDFDALLDDYLL